jgi:polyisoprenoid-binding protein YceI
VSEVILETESGGVTLDGSGSERARFSAKTAIRRRDFGASGNVGWDNYGVMIGERIDIQIDVEAVRQPAAPISFSSDIHDVTVTHA